ncbi:MAG: hypothetical protein EHM63_07905 [Actinobacteria bacterium]|nr:MAG: hypothetical protein EHM63_07905 [Actinomycetota bacterium]
MLARRVGLGFAAWAVASTSVWVFVARPEHCPPIDAPAAEAAAARAVGWFAANQHPDGSWVYRYDRANETDLGGYNITRHAGVMLSLYQAGDIDGGDRGLRFAAANLTRREDWAALGTGTLETGATALLVAALGERRLQTGDPAYDELLAELGRFLLTQTEPDGTVLSEWSSAQDAPVAGRTSSFSTGETWLAFGRLERIFPSNGWREPAELVGRYVMERRDDAEDIYPPTSDHWGAYALDEMQHWSELPSESLTQLTDAYAERLAGIFGVQVRFESQRTEQSVNVLLRGHQALPAGLGTLGEGLGALWRYEDARGDVGARDAIVERASCAAGMLDTRQVVSDDARIDGAWFHSDVTQMDDQQHPLSTLIAIQPIVGPDG